MKLSRSAAVRFSNGQAGSALAVHVKIKASADQVSRVNREGIVYLHLAVKTNAEIAAGLAAYLAKLLTLDASTIEVVGSPESADRLVAITGMNAEELQQRIMAAAR